METCHILFIEAESLRYFVFSLTHFDFIMFYILTGCVLIGRFFFLLSLITCHCYRLCGSLLPPVLQTL